MIRRFLKIFIKYTSLIFAVLIPVLIIYGTISPWPPAQDKVLNNSGELALLIGTDSEYRGEYEKHTKSYLIINGNKLESEIVSLTIDSKGLNEVTREDGGLIKLLTVYLLFIFATWWFWIKPLQITKPSKGQRP